MTDPDPAPGSPDAPTATLTGESPEVGTERESEATGGTRRERRKQSTRRSVIGWVIWIAAALLIALVIRTFLFQAFWIPSPSMVPTLVKNDRVLVNKLAYDFHNPRRGDIVVFTAPRGVETADIKDLVKRIIGLPGDTVQGRSGHIYIDGRRLEEPYLPKGTQSKTFGPIHVPRHDYYVLGDNRLISKDSTVFGPITRSMIVGRVFLRVWPISRIGFL